MSTMTTITLTDDQGTEFLVHMTETPAVLNDANHAKNFAKYLHRAGREQPNGRTHLNRRWRKDGTAQSADYRTPEGAASLARLTTVFAGQWADLHNDICYIEPAEGPTDVTDDQLRTMYSYLWGLTKLGSASGVMVTHHDQNSPSHVHHVRHKDTPSLYEALVDAGLLQ